MSENSHVVLLDVYVERDGAESYVGAIELPLRDEQKWREIEGNLVRGQVVEVTRETVGAALLGLTIEDELALEALPGKLEEAAEEHARNWLIDRGMADRPRDTSWRREAVAVLLEDYKQGLASSEWVIAAIESILLWPKGADL